jgi:hypothetical protein
LVSRIFARHSREPAKRRLASALFRFQESEATTLRNAFLWFTCQLFVAVRFLIPASKRFRYSGLAKRSTILRDIFARILVRSTSDSWRRGFLVMAVICAAHFQQRVLLCLPSRLPQSTQRGSGRAGNASLREATALARLFKSRQPARTEQEVHRLEHVHIGLPHSGHGFFGLILGIGRMLP